MAKTIIDTLLHQAVITQQQAVLCVLQAEKEAVSPEQWLIKKNIITPEQLAQAYAEYASIEYIPFITDEMADISLLSQIPFSFLKEHQVIPISYKGRLTIVGTNPLQFQSMDELNLLLGGNAYYAVTTPAVVMNTVNKYYPLEGTKQVIEKLAEEEASDIDKVAFEEIEEKDILSMASEAPVIKVVNHILFQAVKRGASDIHIEPFEKEMRVRYRIDGVMYDIMHPPKRVQGALISRIKIMSQLDIAEKRLPQGGRIAIKVADKAIDIRVSILPVNFGERVVMRLLDKARTFASLEAIGMTERDYQVLIRAIERPNGIFYVTGPTGSGKTTTLYSVLGRLNTQDVNIITVEDPVEYQMMGIAQVQVYEKIGLTFAAALREILRQDPDIVMIGETRDSETAEIAIRAALTGHLVLSTLHTNNAPAAITRLIDMGVEPFLIASSVTAILAQRLVRRLCQLCKKPYQPPQDLIKKLGVSKQQIEGFVFFQAIGCAECNKTGYKGRLAIFEIMEVTPEIAQLTMDRADTSVIRKQAQKEGMTLLLDDGLIKIKQGVTTIEEVLAVAAAEYDFQEE